MPQILSDDGISQTVLDDNGSIVVIPAGSFDFGPPPAPVPPPGAMPPGFGGEALPPASEPPVAPGPASGLPAAAIAPVSTQPDSGMPPPPGPDTTVAPPPPPAPPPTTFEGTTAEGLAAIEDRGAAQQQVRQVQAKQQTATGQQLDDRNAAIADLQRQRDEQHAKDLEEQQALEAKLTAAVDEEANYKIDNNRRWHNMSNGQKSLAAIGMIFSGLGMALKGQGEQKNPAIAMLEEANALDIQEQMGERERLGAKAKSLGTAADRFRAMSSDRVAEYNLRMASAMESTAREIEANASKFGAETTTANAAVAAAEVRASKAGFLANAFEAARSRKMEDKRLANESAQVGLARRKFGLDLKQFEEGKRQFDKTLELNEQKVLLDAARLDAEGRKAEAAALRARAKEERELAIGGIPRIDGVDKNGKPIVRFEPLKMTDGTTFQAPDSTSAREIREQKEAADIVAHFVDETVRLIEDAGGSSNLVKSKEWQQIQSNSGMIQNKLRIAYKMGALDKGALAQMEKLLGGADPTSFVYDAIPGLRQARKQVVESFNSTLTANGFDGRYELPENTSAGVHGTVKNTAAGELLKTAETRQDAPDDLYGVAGAVRQADTFRKAPRTGNAILDAGIGKEVRSAQGVADATLAATGGKVPDAGPSAMVPQEARQAIQGLLASAKAGSGEAQQALQVLARDPNSAVRALVMSGAAGLGVSLGAR